MTGTVGNLAQAGPATPNPVNLGNVRVGAAAPSQALSITNTATGPAEGLNASISTVAGVPEPTTPMLLLLAVAMLWMARTKLLRQARTTF